MYKSILVLCFIFSAYCFQANYYWRDYSGDIPPDAIIGGTNVDKRIVYIGQAYVKTHGVMVVHINPGVKEVFACVQGIQNITKGVKILCGCQANFYWMKTNRSTYKADVSERIPVHGGHEDKFNFNSMTIGRIIIDENVHIGKINAFWAEPSFYYNNNGSEVALGTYEVLIYLHGASKLS